MIERSDIEIAAGRISAYVRETPVIALEDGAFGLDAEVFLKLESLQHTSSFKPRGAFNRILSSDVTEAGVIAASGGNHGAAVAFAARRLGHRAEVFVPTISSRSKVELIERYGPTLRVEGSEYAEALRLSLERAEETGALMIHAYDQPEVVAGQGTLGREFDLQTPGLDTLLVATGGGGLISGVAAWYRDSARIVCVEPAVAPTLHEALENDAPLDVKTGGIAADSLGARRVGDVPFSVAREFVDLATLVEDDAIREAQRLLWRDLRLVAEPGGATALAALISGSYRPEPGERLGVIVCGGNTDPTELT